jgi:hypothetical protein
MKRVGAELATVSLSKRLYFKVRQVGTVKINNGETMYLLSSYIISNYTGLRPYSNITLFLSTESSGSIDLASNSRLH